MIGLLGGMSWVSTAEYYRLVNELVARRLGGLHSARCLVASVDFADVAVLQRAGAWAEAGELLAGVARSLQAGGATQVLICTNTMHLVADAVQAAVDVPVLDIIDVTAEAIRRAGASRVGLLGTTFTMEHGFYRERMARHGIDVVVPGAAYRAEVSRVIFQELCRGQVLDSSRATYRQVMADLVGHGAEAVVLGCTEIELLVGAADAEVPVLPTTRLHVEAAVDAELASA